MIEVSTHAPRTGRGTIIAQVVAAGCGFNPRAPYGARPYAVDRDTSVWVFQPTRPVRGAACRTSGNSSGKDVSTHAPRTGRGMTSAHGIRSGMSFNPRAPYGARPHPCRLNLNPFMFQPTRPVRGAASMRWISASCRDGFNPRAPYGARPDAIANRLSVSKFQPTRPVRGAAGARSRRRVTLKRFNPRAPYGARRGNRLAMLRAIPFQPTRPVRGAA